MSCQTQQPGKKELREFGLVTGAIAVLLFGLLLPWLFDHEFPRWPYIIAGVLWVWALLLPLSLLPVYRGWMAIGHVLGWINTRIILGLIFYTVFFPVGLIMKIIGNDPMSRKINKATISYRVASRPHNKNHVERPY